MKKITSLFIIFLLVLSLSACKGKNETANNLKDGTYVVNSEKGYNQTKALDVTVEIKDAKITKIDVKNEETESIGGLAIENLVKQIIARQSIDLDVISGATLSSNALLSSVKLALDKAGGANLLKSVSSEVEVKNLNSDVVVVGAGGAGLVAAINLKLAGKDVIVLEKGQIPGGNSAKATGGMNAAKTNYQDENEFKEEAGLLKNIEKAKENYPELSTLIATVEKQYEDYLKNPKGYFDSSDLFALDTLIGGKNINNPELVKTLAENSAKAISWLEKIGAKLTSVSSFGGGSVKRIHRPLNEENKVIPVGTYLIKVLDEKAKELGIKVFYDTKADELIVDNDRVIGVKAGNNTFNAKAVILATGGFAANEELVTKYRPDLKSVMNTNVPTITGDGILMANAIGAKLIDMDKIQVHPTVAVKNGQLITEGLRGDGAILVNKNGERFVDEVGTRDYVSKAENEQEDGIVYLIVDEKMADKSNVIKGYIKNDLTISADNYEELAKKLEINSDNFVSTMENWNKAVENKKDELFNRTSFAEKLDKAPYYAIRVAPGVHHTMGGISINSKAQVLRENDTIIKGLYAAGEVTGGVHGANRLGGNAVADFVVFGIIAAESAMNDME